MTQADVVILGPDSAIARGCAESLRAADHEVLSARSLEQVVKLLAERSRCVVLAMEPSDESDWRVLAQRADAPAVIVYAASGSTRDAVRAIRDGAVDFLTERDHAQALLSSVERHAAASPKTGLICEDPLTRELAELALRVADRPVSVFLTGESGTGKEVFAQFIHQQSPRATRPMVAVNCAAIPEQMLEAVLFGFEKGAFTGANRAHAGKFEQADGGTLLLDEVSEIDGALQAKLLRVLQEGEVERLCGSGPRKIDVRVIATSNRDLRSEVEEGRFREDLYYRLHVFPLRLPALRERPRDILPLAETFIRRHCIEPDRPPKLTAAAARQLVGYDWPGNVRELENVIQRGLVMVDDQTMDVGDLRFDDVPRINTVTSQSREQPLGTQLRDQEQQLIIDTLREFQGSRSAAAERLGISVRTLRHKLQRMREQGLDVPAVARAQFA